MKPGMKGVKGKKPCSGLIKAANDDDNSNILKTRTHHNFVVLYRIKPLPKKKTI